MHLGHRLGGPLLVLGSLALGCSAPSEEGARTASAVAEAVFDSDYLVFGTRDEAVTWFEGMRPLLAGVIGPGAPPLLPAGDPRTARVEAIVARHWPTIQAKFATNIPVPTVLTVDSQVSNAFAVYDLRAGKMAGAIIVLAKLLDASDENVDAIVLHELGHYVMKNLVPANAAAVKHFYLRGAEEPIGLVTSDDPAVRAVVTEFQGNAGDVGPFPLAELHGFPTGSGATTQFFNTYVRQHITATKACNEFSAQIRSASTTLAGGVVPDGTDIVLAPDQLVSLDAAAAASEAASFSCFQPAPDVSFTQGLAATFGVPLEAIEADLTPALRALIDGKDALTGLYGFVKAQRESMRALEASPSYPLYRAYTNEEQADDFAMSVLFAEGRDAARMGLAVLAVSPPVVGDACQDVLDRGEEPPYGLLDPHHTPCFRAFHARQFRAYLEGGGAGLGAAHVAPPSNVDRTNGKTFNPRVDRVAAD